jgi:hypothetical protein
VARSVLDQTKNAKNARSSAGFVMLPFAAPTNAVIAGMASIWSSVRPRRSFSSSR